MPNVFDVFVVIAFMGLVTLGFFHGLARLAASAFAVYFGAIFAAAFYRPLTDSLISLVPAMGRGTGELATFLVLFIGFALVFSIGVSRWMGKVSLPRCLRILDTIGGALMGVIVGGLAVTVTVMLLSFSLQVMDRVTLNASSPWQRFLQGGIEDSALVPIFLHVAPFFVRLIAPLIPGDVPPILRRVR
ncbi:MAG TPA: CvpA family protein [Thermomicrobiales bacterium]|nr:CvpA family protein [Thermomicrobiales bacterium]